MDAHAEPHCPSCFSATTATPCSTCGWQPSADNPPPALALGIVLDGRYRLGRVLGHGGFGITYLAWDENLQLRLAIKEYLPRDSASRAPDGVSLAVYSGAAGKQFAYGLDRFLDEARALARFDQHPGIVTVKSFFRAYGTGYSVMDYVEGLTLKQYLAAQPGGRLPFESALTLLLPIMDALRAVHQEGLLHRDIAPDNIYVSANGRIKLLDFGAARFAAGEHSKSLSVILKPGYAPEEQYRSKGKQGPWTDVYSLAATLYHATTGILPPEALDRVELDELIPPSRLGIAIAPAQEVVLLKALAVRATDRYPSMAALQEAWREASMPTRPGESDADVPAAPKPVPMVPRKASEVRKWISATLALLLVGTVLGGGSLFYLRGQQQARQADLELQRQQQEETMHAAEVRRLAELTEQRKAEEARLAELQQHRAAVEAAAREAERVRLEELESQVKTPSAAVNTVAQDLPQTQAAPGVKVPLYFAADLAPTENIPREAPLCYKFMVDGPEAQLSRLKAKYADLYDDKVLNNDDGSQTLLAKRKDESGKIISYFYSTSPDACNDYQKSRSELTATSSGNSAQENQSKCNEFACVRLLAEEGNADAQYQLGSFYEYGINGAEKNDYLSNYWYRKAASAFHLLAEKGNIDAKFNLGEMYESGDGVDENADISEIWYRNAAEQCQVVNKKVPENKKTCVISSVKDVGTRLSGSNGKKVPGSGTAIYFKNELFLVSYDTVRQAELSKNADKVKICLMYLPEDCPPGDDRGKTYTVINLRTGKAFTMQNATHHCGGA